MKTLTENNRYNKLKDLLDSLNIDKPLTNTNETSDICKEYGLSKLEFSINKRNPDVIILDMVESAKPGSGTSVMKDICKYADDNGKILALSPTSKFVGEDNYKRLTDFYKRFGFRETTHKDNKYTHCKMIRYGNK